MWHDTTWHDICGVLIKKNIYNLFMTQLTWIMQNRKNIWKLKLTWIEYSRMNLTWFWQYQDGNSRASKIMGIDDICMEINLGSKLLLKDVRHILNIRLNLISTGRLDDEVFTNYFGESKLKLTKSSLVIARWKKMNKLCVTQAKLQKREINTI